MNCWPTLTQDHLLRAALLDGEPARASLAAWRTLAGAEPLDAGSVRLLPLLFRRAAKLESGPRLLPRWREAYLASWSNNQMLFHQLAGILAACREAGLETMVLKGAPLAMLHYKDEGARPMGDVDLLVRPAAVPAAVAVLRRLGWVPDGEPLDWPAEPRHSWPFTNGEGRAVDLHWRVFSTGYAPEDDLWAAAVPLDVRGEATRALSPADEFLHAVVHGLAWNPVPSIRWAADAAVVVRSAGDAFDWDRLLEQSSKRESVETLSRALAYLRPRLNVPIPAPVVDRLRAQSRSATERIALWSRMHSGVAAGASRLWFDYLAHARSRARRVTPAGFWHFLRAYWQLPPDRSVRVGMMARMRTRLGR